MTREEKQKAIYALKKSTPIMAVTQEEFSAYIQTINKVIDWLEQEPCEDAISREAILLEIDKIKDNYGGLLDVARFVRRLPPIQPK